MIDHILDHLHFADEYATNAARILAVNKRSKRLREFSRRCTEAAEQERAAAIGHATQSGIDPLVVTEEYATWRRLRQYPLDGEDTLTVCRRALVADRRPLRASQQPQCPAGH
ncbi:hypothetical protein H7849_23795 [Alloacidobacterium dinghuense]|uniref:Uncharacterized protein n=1 Tax=Alloacidobacterium dinghuense TaxID=2763107 RepID=A0A7G8BHH9_9BACT|nr:hypothetical protein [Alloacidobacterium dinghuense]QNI31999.1 hypothetical protein H7849_23795 [Alloacidobacterium dinghuense]